MWLRPTASWSPSTPTSRIVSGANGSSRPTSITLPSCSSRTTSGRPTACGSPSGTDGAGRQRVTVAGELDVHAASVGDAHQDLQRALDERALPAHPGDGVGEVGERGELRVAPQHLAAQVALAGDRPMAVPEDPVLAHEGQRPGDRPGRTPDRDRERARAVHDVQHGERRREDREEGDGREEAAAHGRLDVVRVGAAMVVRQHAHGIEHRHQRQPDGDEPQRPPRRHARQQDPVGERHAEDRRARPARAARERHAERAAPRGKRAGGRQRQRRALDGREDPEARGDRRDREAEQHAVEDLLAARLGQGAAQRRERDDRERHGREQHEDRCRGWRHTTAIGSPGGRSPAPRPDLRDPSGPDAYGAITRWSRCRRPRRPRGTRPSGPARRRRRAPRDGPRRP